MLLEHQGVITEFSSPFRWKELSKETGSKILPSGDGSCWKTFKPIASLIPKGLGLVIIDGGVRCSDLGGGVEWEEALEPAITNGLKTVNRGLGRIIIQRLGKLFIVHVLAYL
ncbi:hypothetical protein Tco_0517143 [Tanacetum coccineum]